MLSFDIEKFAAQYFIQTWPAGSKNVPAGHIGVTCPFCGDKSNHMHFRLDTLRIKCWRCGKHTLNETISAILRIPRQEAKTIADQFIVKNSKAPVIHKFEKHKGAEEVIWPVGMGDLDKPHMEYLFGRGFDPYELSRTWNLRGTNHLDKDYRWRIIAPVFWQGKAVTFQARDITGKQEPRYRAARPTEEVLPIGNLLYGANLARRASVVVVEGIADAWRLGPGAVAVFGVEWTPAQAKALIVYWPRVFILFDPDEAGVNGSTALFNYLKPIHNDLHLLSLEGSGYKDPGELPAGEARHLMEKELKVR